VANSYASAYSSFRVNFLPLFILISVFFRVRPWLIFCCFCLFGLLSRHKDLNNAQNTLISYNLSPNLDISEKLYAYEGGLVAALAFVNMGKFK
jgi:hypothetical protein